MRFMVWLGRGWDTPLDSAADLYKYGRPANAEVLSVEGAEHDSFEVKDHVTQAAGAYFGGLRS
jgi:hypothetical protein